MKTILGLMAVAAMTSGCATLWPEPVGTHPRAAEIAVYEAFPPSARSYQLVKRVWVDGWTSAYRVPAYPSVEAGAADIRNQAALLGGDAVMNFGCYHKGVDPASAYYCNGNVIRYLN